MTPQYRIIPGDCLKELCVLPDESVDAILTDPPAGIAFMGQAWDHDKGGRREWIAWLAQVMRECLRVAKPGAHAAVWALPRTSHWTGTALEEAGWEIRHVVTHHFSSGFPKAMNAAKAVGKRFAGDREGRGAQQANDQTENEEGKRFDGWATALKPSTEFWFLARKPFVGTLAANLLAHGTGALNIEACRVQGAHAYTPKGIRPGTHNIVGDDWDGGNQQEVRAAGRWPPDLVLSHAPGPQGCQRVGTKRVRSTAAHPLFSNPDAKPLCWGSITQRSGETVNYGDSDGLEEVDAWECVQDCPVGILDAQSGVLRSGNVQDGVLRRGSDKTRNCYGHFAPQDVETPPIYGDEGGASRFFPQFPGDDSAVFLYAAKASRAEREAGLEDFPEIAAGIANASGRGFKTKCSSCGGYLNRSDGVMPCECEEPVKEYYRASAANHHPTVKNLALCRWLARLLTPPRGTLLDPFLGSGTTIVSALLEGFDSIGIEREPSYVKIAGARCAHWSLHRDEYLAEEAGDQRAAQGARAIQGGTRRLTEWTS